MSVLMEGKYLGDWLKFEQDNHYSREKITVLGGDGADRVLKTGMVLGKIALGEATPAAVAGNAGTGTIGSVTVGVTAKVGVYRAVCIEPASNSGKFQVEDPDGIIVGVATVAVAFTGGGLTFTISDGDDFVSGDSFTITVAAGSGMYVQIDDAGTGGSKRAAGILLLDVTAPNGVDVEAVAIVRDALISPAGITWPSGFDANEKAAALAQLAEAGIITREAA